MVGSEYLKYCLLLSIMFKFRDNSVSCIVRCGNKWKGVVRVVMGEFGLDCWMDGNEGISY